MTRQPANPRRSSALRILFFASAAFVLTGTYQARAADKVDVLIRFSAAPGKAQSDLVRKHGGLVKNTFKIVPAVSAQLPSAALARMRKERGVVAVELDSKVFGHDIENTWGVKRIGADPVHTGSFAEGAAPVTGAGVKVAIVDSGIDYTHPELVGSYMGGFDYVNNDSDPYDDHGHGTHVAGTVAAARNGSGVVGAAHGVSLYAVKVLGADGSGSWSWIISSLDWCLANGIQVANFSLGSSGHPGSTFELAFANAEAAGLLLVASAGNAGEGADTVGYPAKFASVIAVASTTNSDQRSSFSSTGPAVELAAPGSSIYSTLKGGGYGYMSGTSMAAPHVSGAAALIIAAGIADADKDGKINDEVRDLLQLSAEDLGAAGRDPYFGFGLVDAELAVLAIYDAGNSGPENPAPIFDAPSGLGGSVTGNSVFLNWTDNSNVESGFQVQFGVKVKRTTTWSELGSTAADVTTLSTTMNSGKYLFRVRAFDSSSGAVTAWSNVIELSVGSTSGGGGGTKGGPKK